MAFNRYEEVYYVRLMDDLHNYFPAILYDASRFQTVPQLLSYVSSQASEHFNTFSRASRHFRTNTVMGGTGLRTGTTPPTATTTPPVFVTTATPGVQWTTETIDITPMFTQTFPRNRRTIIPGAENTGFLDNLLNLFTAAGAGGIPEPVIVAPTQEQINISTRLYSATLEDEDINCSICQESYAEGQGVRQIIQCRHKFHQTCLDPWLQRNVHCPVCRFDVREHLRTTDTEAGGAEGAGAEAGSN